MNPIRSQPALKLLIPFCCGIVAGPHVSINTAWLILLAGLALVLALWNHVRSEPLFFGISATMLIFLIAVLHINLDTHLAAGDIRLHLSPDPVAVEGLVVNSVQRRMERQTFVIRVDSIWQKQHVKPACGLIYIQLYDTSLTIAYGNRLMLKGQLRQPPAERNPGDFNFRQYLASRDIHAVLRVTDVAPLLIATNEGECLEQNIFMPLRRHVQRLLFDNMSESGAALLYGLLIGDRSEMDEEIEQDFRDVGVIHVLAVSGMHVGFIIAALFFFLKKLPVNPWQRTFLLLLAIWFYARLTGLQSPVARASLMAGLFLLAPLLQRRADPVNTICVAALVLLIIQPLQLFTAGFQLSFAACLGMILLYQQYHPSLLAWYDRHDIRNKPMRYVIDLFLVSLSAQIATLPIVIYYFNNLPLIALLANIPIIPFTGVIMGIGFLAVASAVVAPFLGIWLLHCDEILITLLVKLVHLFSLMPWSHFSIPRPSVLMMAVIFSSIGLLVFWRRILLRKRVLVVIILLLNLYVWNKVGQDPLLLRATFFDVGQGDAALFEFPDGRTLLVDGGDRTGRFDYGERVVAPYLRRTGIRRLDNIIITHPHADHLGGIINIISNFSVGRILVPKIVYQDSLTHIIDSLICTYHIAKKQLCRGDTLAGYKHCFISILNPGKEDSLTTCTDLNDRSVVFKMVYGSCSFLMTGDAGLAMEKKWLEFGNLLKSDIVKVAHHGSSTASSVEFCRKASPQYAVFSVAERNRFNHPSPLIVSRWLNSAARITATAEKGAVVFACNGTNIERIR